MYLYIMEELYGWLFTYNPYDKQWLACRNEDFIYVMNDYSSDKAIRSSSKETLIELIIKYKGCIDLIKQGIK